MSKILQLPKGPKFQDLTGEVYNSWTVLGYAGFVTDADGNKTFNSKWKCMCVCGRQKEITGSNLKSGRSRSCGCTVTRYDDLTGRVDDDVTVIGYPLRSKRVSASGKIYPKVSWVVACQCGSERSVKRLSGQYIKKRKKNLSCCYNRCTKPKGDQETIDRKVQEFLKKEAEEAGIELSKYLSQWN